MNSYFLPLLIALASGIAAGIACYCALCRLRTAILSRGSLRFLGLELTSDGKEISVGIAR